MNMNLNMNVCHGSTMPASLGASAGELACGVQIRI